MRIALQDEVTFQSNTMIDKFLAIPLADSNGIVRGRRQLERTVYPREELSRILYTYNEGLGNDATALNNAQRLADPSSVCVVTGQQLGFMGGPLLTFLKVISCLLLARDAEAIPIFWAATEDHDIAEINHAYQLDPRGNLTRYQLNWPETAKAIEDLQILPQHVDVIRSFCQSVAALEAFQVTAGEGYADAMMRLLVKAFAGTGLVFLEPRLLRPLAMPLFQKELANCDEMASILRATTLRFEAAGGKPPLTISKGPNLFIKEANGHRRKIIRDEEAFRIGRQRYHQTDLLTLVESHPDLFSPSAALRPIIQSALLPTLAYVAGPTEIAYHCQLGDYFKAFGVSMPWIVPRISATFITPEVRRILDVLSLAPSDLLPMTWKQVIPDVDAKGECLAKAIRQELESYFGDELSTGGTENAIDRFVNQIKQMEVRKRLKQQEVPYHALHLLHNLLHPQEKPQERMLNWWYFQACSKSNLVSDLMALLDWRERRHYYLTIEG